MIDSDPAIDPDTTGIAVVVPVFNSAATLGRAIGSILRQTYPPDEIVLVDDGSTDNGMAIAQSLGDSRLRILRQSNNGPSAARNRGVRECESQFIAFLDADDEWLPEHLQDLVELAMQHPSAGLWAGGYRTSKENHTQETNRVSNIRLYSMEEYMDARLNGQKIVWTSAVLMRRSVFFEAGGFMEGVHHGEDQALWLITSMTRPIAKHFKVTAIYHTTPGSLSAKIIFGEDACMITVCRILEQSPGLNKAQVEILEDFRAWFALAHAMVAIEYGNPRVAAKHIKTGAFSKRFKWKYRLLHMLMLISQVFPSLGSGLIRFRKQIKY